MTDEEKTGELLHLIEELCDSNSLKGTNSIDKYILKLRDIYADNYRHSYYKISCKLQEIIRKSAQSEVLEALGENLNVLGNQINEFVAKHNNDPTYEDLVRGYNKLSDHISLETSRYNFIKVQVQSEFQNYANSKSGVSEPNSAQIQKLQNDFESTRNLAGEAKKQLDNLDNKLESNKISSITTLTIFSAVVLAFSGGITFESGIFKGMAESSPYRLAFTIALSGFILFNTICVLLYLVGKMAGKQISTRCRYLAPNDGNCKYCQSCGDGRCTKECAEVSIACRIWHKYSYVFVVNVVLLYVIYSDFFFWLSKGDLLSPVFYLSQGFLALLIVLSIIVHCVHKHKCLERIKLHYKVEILCGIIEKGTSDKASPPKSATGCFLNKICGKELNKKDDVLRYLDEFVDEYLADNCRLSILVTKQEHYVNCRKWFELSEKLNISLIKPLLDK